MTPHMIASWVMGTIVVLWLFSMFIVLLAGVSLWLNDLSRPNPPLSDATDYSYPSTSTTTPTFTPTPTTNVIKRDGQRRD